MDKCWAPGLKRWTNMAEILTVPRLWAVSEASLATHRPSKPRRGRQTSDVGPGVRRWSAASGPDLRRADTPSWVSPSSNSQDQHLLIPTFTEQRNMFSMTASTTHTALQTLWPSLCSCQIVFWSAKQQSIFSELSLVITVTRSIYWSIYWCGWGGWGLGHVFNPFWVLSPQIYTSSVHLQYSNKESTWRGFEKRRRISIISFRRPIN